MKAIILSAITVCILIGARNAFAMSDYESGYERGMNDASAGCNPDICHAMGLNNQTGKFVNGFFDGFCTIKPNTNQVTFTCPHQSSVLTFMIKGYWAATDKNLPPNMKAYHLFIDGVNPVWGQNGTDNKKTIQLTHDGLEICLSWRADRELCHNVTVNPSAFNVTYDAGFFVLPTTVNQSQLGIGLDTKYQDVGVGVGLGNGHIDLDMLYVDVSIFRSCIEYYHYKPGTDKFHECFEALS
jgi:hypothetical protein